MCIYNVPHCTVNTGVFAIALCVLFYTVDNVDVNTSAWFVSSTDLAITIDSVIQQLQKLIPYWWAVGEAAGLQRSVLKEVLMLLTLGAHARGLR